MVTVQELEQLLQGRGWYLSMTRRHRSRFAYAKRREGKKVSSRYLIAESKLETLTEEDVLKRIQS